MLASDRQLAGWVSQTKVCLNFFTIGGGGDGRVTVLLEKMKGYSIVYCTVESTSYLSWISTTKDNQVKNDKRAVLFTLGGSKDLPLTL